MPSKKMLSGHLRAKTRSAGLRQGTPQRRVVAIACGTRSLRVAHPLEETDPGAAATRASHDALS